MAHVNAALQHAMMELNPTPEIFSGKVLTLLGMLPADLLQYDVAACHAICVECWLVVPTPFSGKKAQKRSGQTCQSGSQLPGLHQERKVPAVSHLGSL